MKPQMHRYAPRAAKFFRPPFSPPCRAIAAAKNMACQFGGLLVLSVVALFILLEPGKLFAQQTQPGNQGWSQNDQSNGQYAPNQQSETQSDYGQQSDAQRSFPDSDQAYSQQGYGQASAPAQSLDAAQLEQLVAPIALYPDTLVAQVVAASTYPGQIADADRWRQMQGSASPDQIVAGADAQNWDPSVKALTAFPQVLAQMDRNQQWTTDLGNAYYNQPQDVLQAVQVMRRRAQAAGTLESTPQQAVDYDQGYIQLTPVNPQVVYVPTYNPWTVYGEQVSPYPGFSLLGELLGASPISYGLGIAMSAFSQIPWGCLSWGLNWLAQSVLFNDSNYYSHSNTVADWGLRHDGLHAYAGRGAFAGHSYGRTSEGFRRFGGGYNRNRGLGFDRAPGRYAENWRGNSNRGFHAFGSGYDRTPRQAHNDLRAPVSRQQFARSGDGSSWNRGTGERYRSGARPSYDHSMQAYRSPASGFQRGEFGGRSSGAFTSSNFSHSAGKPPHSGGFHLFGGGHAPKTVGSRGSGGFHMGGGGHTPKSFHGSGRNFGGGHSHGGGGHSGGHSGGKHHR
ncbi:MAG: hypothetical protein DMG78_08575 [Acidobacteria bacterium]|nr:MAG: hypothetical protein DMG78_08575 [Acidobacteriota bacterium]